MDELGDRWVIKFDEEDESSPLNLCAGVQHAHKSWQEYRQCYVKLQEKYTLHKELRVIRGTKTHKLCRVCANIFADHEEAQCPVGPGSENPSLLKLWDNPVSSFVRFIGMMVEHVRGVQMGLCPLCNVQEDQHDYAICLWNASMELKEGKLNVTTSRRQHGDPPPNPNPTGPTPRTTLKTTQPMPVSKSPGRGTSSDPEMMRGHYTCYGPPCVNCANPFPSHLMPECKEPRSVNIGLRLLWHSVTHRGIQLLAQVHWWNTHQMEDDEPCDVCGKELKEHDL